MKLNIEVKQERKLIGVIIIVIKKMYVVIFKLKMIICYYVFKNIKNCLENLT